jgi:hypothetical protein
MLAVLRGVLIILLQLSIVYFVINIVAGNQILEYYFNLVGLKRRQGPMRRLSFIKRTPRLLKLVVLVAILSAGLKLGLAYADNTYTASGNVTFNGNPAPLGGSGPQVAIEGANGGGANNLDSSGNYSVSGLPNGSYDIYLNYNKSNEDSVTTGVPNYLSLGTNTQPLTVNGANVTQNLSFNTNTVTVTVKDGNGNPVSGSLVQVTATGSNSVTTTDGSETFNLSSGNEQSSSTTGSGGTATVNVFPGVTYTVCAYTASGGQYCSQANITVNGNTAAEVDFPSLYTASGNVTFNGNPAPQWGGAGAKVYFTSSDGNYGTANTDSNGNYSVSGLPNDNYTTNLYYNGGSSNSTPNYFLMSTTTPSVAVNGSNVTQNLPFNTNAVDVTVKDGNGNPVSGSYVTVTAVGNNTVTTADGSETFNLSGEYSAGSSGNDGTVSVPVFPGVTYQVCADTASGGQYCAQANITVNGNTAATVYLEPVPSAPTNLTIPSPTNAPVLTWTGVSGADSYNIYANGSKIGNTTSTTYTDNSPTVGNDTYYVTAVDLAGESIPSNSVDVTVTSDTAPAITSGASTSTGMRVPFSFQVTTTGNPTPAITESGTLPSGVTFTDNGNGTATLAGTAAAGTNGTYPITITAANGIGSNATQSFTLTVTTASSAPTITSASSDTGTTSTPYSFTVTTNGYPIPTLSKTGALPGGVTFTNNGNGTATIAGTPGANSGNTYTLTIKAHSTAGTSTQTFTLTINQVPTLNAISTKVASVGTAFTLTATAHGYPTPALTESGTLPNGLSFVDNGDGTATIAGTPAVGSGGAYSITITATSSVGTVSQTFTLKVKEAPTITSAATANATVGTPFSFQVTTTGFPAPTVTKAGTLPAGVTFSGATDSFSGTPHAGTAGSYPITITATNSSGTVTQNFTLIVS